MPQHGPPQWRNGIVAYAAPIPKAPLDGRRDLTIPGVASIVGELVPDEEGVEFNGSFDFTGSVGYLSFDAAHANGFKLSREFNCPECRKPEPGLFEYISYPILFSNHDTQVLYSEGSLGGRVTHFQATRHLDGLFATFEAQALEWLPGEVAVVRTVEVEKAAGADFKVSSKAEHPKSARIRPPKPFSGSANYRSAGSIRSTAGGKLTGSLSVDIFGVKVPLAGSGAKASLINLNPGY